MAAAQHVVWDLHTHITSSPAAYFYSVGLQTATAYAALALAPSIAIRSYMYMHYYQATEGHIVNEHLIEAPKPRDKEANLDEIISQAYSFFM